MESALALANHELGRVLVDEQRRIQNVVVWVRIAGGVSFLALVAGLTHLGGRADWAVYIPLLAAYSVLALGQRAAHTRFGSYLSSPAALVDIAVVYAAQSLSMPSSLQPAGVAGFSLGLFGLLVILSGLTFRRDVVLVSFLGCTLAQCLLMRQAGVDTGAIAAAIVVLALVAALIAASTDRLRSLAVRVSAREIDRRVAEEQRRASESARLMTEEHLAESRTRNAALAALQADKERLMQLIVHDLRSPLTALMMSLELAKEAQGASEAGASLDLALATTNRLSSMIDDLLTVAKLEEGALSADRQPTVLRELLDQVARTAAPVAARKQTRLEIDCDAALTASLDVRLLQRLLDNLVSNAQRFTKAGGVVQLEARVDAPSLVIGVHNDGPPIPVSERPRLFDKFQQVDAKRDRRSGFGLGLYLCRIVAEAHGGSIAIEDTPGWNCSFVLRVPLGPA